jgi:hypothetical protein
MSDYKQTRDAAGKITSRFSTMLKNLQDEYEDEVVVVSLMRYYEICDENDEDLIWAIERLLSDYMPPQDFRSWTLTKNGGKRG